MEGENESIKKKPKKIEQMTKEQIRQAIIKKRECNVQAQAIVISLLEKCIHRDYFVKCLPNINQSHFEDIIEERSLLHLCGYPLCQHAIAEKDIPKQKYRISVKTNKVYDITARKSFCSNSCYKSAMHIKNQMLTSPLWFREYEEIPNFHLLPLDSIGCLGQEVNLVEKINLKSESFIKSHNIGHNTNNIPKPSTKSLEHLNNKIPTECSRGKGNCGVMTTSCLLQSNIINEITKKSNLEESNKDIQIKEQPVSNHLNIIGEVKEKPVKPLDPILSSTTAKKDYNSPKMKKTTQKKEHQPSPATIMVDVEKSLAEWFTIETLIFLFGENKVKEMTADKGEYIKEYLSNYSNSIVYNSNSYERYQALCHKLNLLELEDSHFDAQAIAKKTKPLPDYSILQEESKKMQLRVKAFFAGETEVQDIQEEVISNTNDVENSTRLPFVDKISQNAIRRKIVCQQLNKVLPDLLKSLNLSTLTITSDVRNLVNTFRLKADNIMFKPIQWTLIAIIYIKLLSIKNSRLKYLLAQSVTVNHLQLLLLSYEQDCSYVDRLIIWLTDIDRLLDSNNI